MRNVTPVPMVFSETPLQNRYTLSPRPPMVSRRWEDPKGSRSSVRTALVRTANMGCMNIVRAAHRGEEERPGVYGLGK
ncbi:hypothetical protein DdX_14422 [Ditylenchus destructor]|uniref:Uncharacterized protein n=1 Tax=Ditylenchus destructor TaxID=166010 RepID=A0AAD4MR59_9BILA|nr:hypothetical protein DdX_14422 [Ditylenchus destructor]